LPSHAADAYGATTKAEEALSEATRQPSDGYIIYRPSEQRSNERALNARCATEIVQCLKEERFKLAYQPIVSALTGEVSMHEALLRMADSTTGELITAGHLVPISENLGLVRLIDRAVMQMIVKTLNTHPDANLAMNVSGTTAMDPRWHAQLLEILAANSDVAPRLTVEVTETVALSNIPSTRQFVESLRKLGASVAIDDFGSGFTSFRNLRDLPVNIIKLDGSFCQDLRNNNENEYIVRSLIDLAGKFKIKTVAEWIQQPEDAEALRSWGVDYLQGNLFGQASMDVPWVSSETPFFALNGKIPEIHSPNFVSVPPHAEGFDVVVQSYEDSSSNIEPEFEISHNEVETIEFVREIEMQAPQTYSDQVHHDTVTELDFGEIDKSISTLRQALSDLKNYFPDKEHTESQTAA
jgi:EAL domain-containing protein (putative c-di-GMP-specific phosphodiesterase class I)